MSDLHLHANVFIADSINILPGTASKAQAFALVALDFVVPAIGQSEIIHAQAATGPFQVGDYLNIHSLDHRARPLAVMKAWFKIVGIIEENTVDQLQGIWWLEHVHGGKVGAVIGKGNTLVNFGKPAEV